MGHEIVGTIIDGGAGLPDSLYTIEPLDACLNCNYCAAGATNICPNMKFIGINEPGGLAESIDVPAHTLHPVPDSLSPLLASMVEPMACSYRGVALGRLKIESRVLVLGARDPSDCSQASWPVTAPPRSPLPPGTPSRPMQPEG